MESPTSQETTAFEPPGGGPWTWWASCLWLPGCTGFGLLLGWAAYQASNLFSPLLVFPLIVGFVLGASIVVLMGLCQMGHRPTAWLAVGLSAAAVVLGQHYFSYRAAVAEADQSLEKVQRAQLAFGDAVRSRIPSPPTGLVDYLRRQAAEGRPLGTLLGDYKAKGTVAWLLWIIDGLLVLGPAALMVGLALQRPFCPHCRSFYGTRRGGRLDRETARRLADELNLPLVDSVGGFRYGLLSCNQGCARTGFSLFCLKPAGAVGPEITWLDDAQRDRITRILDEARNADPQLPDP